MTTELKCVEGWSQVVQWKGVRLADFLEKFAAPTEYVGLSTPLDGQDARGRADLYYVGFDRPSAVHPQTLLCYEMNGQPLSRAHGARAETHQRGQVRVQVHQTHWRDRGDQPPAPRLFGAARL